jgi:hypothetical protein
MMGRGCCASRQVTNCTPTIGSAGILPVFCQFAGHGGDFFFCLEAGGILTHTFFVKFAAPPRRLLGARIRCSRPGRGPKHTARKQHPASPPTGRAVGSGQNPLPGGCMLISPDLYVCLCSSTTKKRVSSYSGSIDSSRRVLLVPCLAAQITRAPANRGLSKSCDAPSAPSN